MIPLGRHCPFQGKTVIAWWDVLRGPAPISTWSLKVLSFPSCLLTSWWSESTENELGGKVYDVGFSSPCSACSIPFHISVGVWPTGVPLSANSPRQENPGRPAHVSSGEVLSYFLKNIINEWKRWVSWLPPFTGNSSSPSLLTACWKWNPTGTDFCHPSRPSLGCRLGKCGSILQNPGWFLCVCWRAFIVEQHQLMWQDVVKRGQLSSIITDLRRIIKQPLCNRLARFGSFFLELTFPSPIVTDLYGVCLVSFTFFCR